MRNNIEQQLKAALQQEYKDSKTFLEDIIFPVFGEDNYESAGNLRILSKRPDLQSKADVSGILDIRQVGGLYVEGSQLDIFDVTLDYKKQLRSNRVEIQQIIRSILGTHSGAFIIFHYESGAHWEWRFTFCHKGASQIDSSDAKRYTFLLGPGQSCRTAAENFMKIHDKIEQEGEFEMKDIIRAFDVEALSKEFFTKYKTHYEKFCQFVYDNKHNPEFFGEEFTHWEDKTIRDYVKKLLGRIVFLHFLQKKGWMGVPEGGTWGDGDRQYMRSLFKNSKAEEKDNYLDKVLEPLFLEMDKILCGGLFERDAMDVPDSRFPAEYFDSLFEFLYEYNFTIDENDPNDAEVGVDPEMLGRIFENLLEDNKDKGAFYTPKEIVQYMCRESLIAYLTTASIESGNPNPREKVEEAIRRLVINPEEIVPKMTDKHKEDFGNALRNVKICDPAIGSGAFPMGLLNELVRCRVAIDAWAKNESGNLLVDDYAALKCEIVCNNIYGVDIERGAIDIARLRFWLSIVVDEKEPHALPNLDYKFMEGNSLIPTFDGQYINLDTNQQTHANVGKMRNEKIKLRKLKQEHFSATGLRKHELAVEIKDSILHLISLQLGNELREWYDAHHPVEQLSLFGESEPKQLSFADIKPTLPPEKQRICDLGAELRKQLRDENIPIEQRAQLDIRFFDWRMMFTEVFDNTKPGFDIVIGNPPYISAPAQIANETLSVQRENIIKSKKFSSLYQKWDLYIPFIEHGIQLLCDGGVTTMIVPYPLTNQTYGKKLRELILSDYTLFELCDLNGTKIFENATVSNCIPFVRKEKAPAEIRTVISHINENREIGHSFSKTPTDLVPDVKTAVWNVGEEKRDANRHAEMHVLGDYCFVSYGLRPNSDEKTAKGEFKKKDLISDIYDEIHCRKYIEAKDIDKYKVTKVHYLEYDTDRSPAKLVRPTFREWFEHPKLFFNRLGSLVGTYDKENQYLHNDSIIGASLWKSLKGVKNNSITSSIKKYSTMERTDMEHLSESVDLRYILGIMNSKYADVLLTNLRAGDYHIYPEHIRNIPIAPATADQQDTIITLVDRILSAKKANPQADTSTEEREIDHLVYDLYGLTEDEIAIVEGRN